MVHVSAPPITAGLTWHLVLKSGYMGFACLEYYADATPPALEQCMPPPAGAQWLADYLHDASRWLVITEDGLCSDVTGRAQHNCRGGVAENSNQANPIIARLYVMNL